MKVYNLNFQRSPSEQLNFSAFEMQRVTRSQTAANTMAASTAEDEQLLEPVPEHIATILAMAAGTYSPSSDKKAGARPPMSAQRIAQRFEFHDSSTGRPLYSVDQINLILAQHGKGLLNSSPAQEFPSPLAVPQRAKENIHSSSTSPGSAITKLEVSLETTVPPSVVFLRLSADTTYKQMISRLLAASGVPSTPAHSFQFQFVSALGKVFNMTELADVLEFLPESGTGTWVFRPVIPLTLAQDRTLPPDQSAAAQDISRRLTFGSTAESVDSQPLTTALKWQQLEQLAITESKEAVKQALVPYGGKLGKAEKQPVLLFFKALCALDDLSTVRVKLETTALRRANPSSEQQRLQWFVEAIIEELDEDVKARWKGQANPLSREASFYSSWPQFRAAVFTTIRNRIDFTPEGLMEHLHILVNPAKCDSRQDFWVAIERVQDAAKTLAAMKSTSATAQIEASTVKYIQASLSADATKAIIEVLANKHRAEANDYYADKKHPPLQAYSAALLKEVMLGRDDFDDDWRNDLRDTKGLPPPTPPFSAPSPAAGPTDKAPKTRPAGDKRQRRLKRNNKQYVFPYHLKDEPDASERTRLEAEFLQLTLVDWTCNTCGSKGHTADVCPKSFALDNREIERNEKSFFYGLRPPAALLKLRRAGVVMPVVTVHDEVGTAVDVSALVARVDQLTATVATLAAHQQASSSGN